MDFWIQEQPVFGTCLRLKEESLVHNQKVKQSGPYASFSDLVSFSNILPKTPFLGGLGVRSN